MFWNITTYFSIMIESSRAAPVAPVHVVDERLPGIEIAPERRVVLELEPHVRLRVAGARVERAEVTRRRTDPEGGLRDHVVPDIRGGASPQLTVGRRLDGVEEV